MANSSKGRRISFHSLHINRKSATFKDDLRCVKTMVMASQCCDVKVLVECGGGVEVSVLTFLFIFYEGETVRGARVKRETAKVEQQM